MPRSPHAWKQRTSKWTACDNAKIDVIADVRDGYRARSRVVHTKQSRVHQPDDVFGERVMGKGEHRFLFEVEPARSSGSGVRVGVASVDGRQRWGIRLTDGKSVHNLPGMPTAEDRERERESSAFYLSDNPVAQERAVVQRVEVIVDMARRHVLYSIDGGSAVDSGVLPDEYPDSLTPWAQLFYKGDAVTLSAHRSRTASRPKAPRTPTRKAASPSEPTCDAGPWTP